MTNNGGAIKLDLMDVHGLEHAKRALEICAAGGHRLLFRGPKGCGAEALTQCLSGILPTLDGQDAATVVSYPARADMQVLLEPADIYDSYAKSERSGEVRERVRNAQVRQAQRQNVLSSRLKSAHLKRIASLDVQTTEMLEATILHTCMSIRDTNRAIRIARTIADIAGSVDITRVHLAEALIYSHPRRRRIRKIAK